MRASEKDLAVQVDMTKNGLSTDHLHSYSSFALGYCMLHNRKKLMDSDFKKYEGAKMKMPFKN